MCVSPETDCLQRVQPYIVLDFNTSNKHELILHFLQTVNNSEPNYIEFYSLVCSWTVFIYDFDYLNVLSK